MELFERIEPMPRPIAALWSARLSIALMRRWIAVETTMSGDKESVLHANEGFYRAFESLDAGLMEKVWARDDSIQCGHPGWQILRGWKPVMESWRRIFENTPEIRFMLTDVSVEVRGAIAWVTLYEDLIGSVEGEHVSAKILTTNIFEKGPEGWRLILHHGSPVAQPVPAADGGTVH